MILNLLLYFCGALVTRAYIEAVPIYPKAHRLRYMHTVSVILWPLVVLFAIGVFIFTRVKEIWK